MVFEFSAEASRNPFLEVLIYFSFLKKATEISSSQPVQVMRGRDLEVRTH